MKGTSFVPCLRYEAATQTSLVYVNRVCLFSASPKHHHVTGEPVVR